MAKIMKDGKPSTRFSRQDREWVKSMGGGSQPSGTITITENGEYDVSDYATADVQVEGGSSDFSTAKVTITNLTTDGVVVFPCIGADYGDGMETWDTMEIMTAEPDTDGITYSIPVFKDGSILMISGNPPYTIAVAGDITEDSGSVIVSGNGTIIVS